MKIRKGFVSNSSSTSFMIIVKPSNVCKYCGRKDFDILDLIEKTSTYNCDGNSIHAIGKEEVISHIIENWCDGSDREKMIKKIKSIKGTTKKIAYVSVSYHDAVINDMIKNSKNVEILYNSGD